jgi:hypothetical protein
MSESANDGLHGGISPDRASTAPQFDENGLPISSRHLHGVGSGTVEFDINPNDLLSLDPNDSFFKEWEAHFSFGEELVSVFEVQITIFFSQKTLKRQKNN